MTKQKTTSNSGGFWGVDLLSKVEKEGISLNGAALIDVALVTIMFMALSSKFILAPGLGIDLNGEPKMPTIDANNAVLCNYDAVVLHIQGKNMFIFDGKINSFEAFKKTLKDKGDLLKNQTLLLKTDKNCDAQTIIDVCAAAKSAGLKSVQIAACPEKEIK